MTAMGKKKKKKKYEQVPYLFIFLPSGVTPLNSFLHGFLLYGLKVSP